MSQVVSPRTLGPEDAGMLLSRDEYSTWEFAEPWTYERVQGRLVVLPPVGAEHRNVAKPFRRELGGYWSQHRDVVDDVDYEGWIATSEDDDRIPDICLDLVGPQSGSGVPYRIPDVIYEFLSEGQAAFRRDFIEKRAEYHRVKVPEYVVVDRFRRQVHVFAWQPGDYAETILTAADVYTSPQLPGLSIPLSEAFPD